MNVIRSFAAGRSRRRSSVRQQRLGAASATALALGSAATAVLWVAPGAAGAQGAPTGPAAAAAKGPAAGAQVPAKVPLKAPSPDTIPAGPMGDSIRLGEKVLTQTQIHAKKYVGNGLNCTSCHLDGGKTPYASPWVGIWAVFPEYRARNAAVNALQDRVNDCFQRSMNGRPLPPDSAEMRGILAYMWWLSKGVPVGAEVEGRGFARIKLADGAKPDPVNGKKVYAEKCASCHGADGQGITGAKGEYMFPALWGPKSFNIGAGMARLNNAAAFVKANMPLGQGNTLSDQEAFDVSAYFIAQPRPDFAAKSRDWPKGDKPVDARY